MEENTAPPSFTPPPAAQPPPPPPPPPLTPPPVIMPPASTPPRKRGRGWMIFAIILLVLLGCSMLVNVGHMLTGFGPMKDGRMNTVGPHMPHVDEHAAYADRLRPYEGRPNEYRRTAAGGGRDRGQQRVQQDRR